MTVSTTNFHKMLMSSVAGCALLATSFAAHAGGIAVREQSAQFAGSSFAGNGAGGGLSSSFWNTAAIGEAGAGLTSESHASMLFSDQEFTVLEDAALPINGLTAGDHASADTEVLITSSYQAFRLSESLVVGMAINAPFGVGTELDDKTGSFRFHHRSAKIFTLNANPMASYEVMPGLFVGAGVQVQFIDVKFKTVGLAGVPNPAAGSSGLRGDDIGFGFTGGLLWKPNDSTSIGVGYRSAVAHKVEGEQFNLGTGANADFSLEITTPEMVTASIRQKLSDDITLLGTVEWTNWDRLGVIPIEGPATGPLAGATFDFQYHEGWFFALGGEWATSEKLTLRAGAAYEISPVTKPTERLVQIPDADRFWLSAGATYKVNHMMSLDFAYTHVFIDDEKIDRLPARGTAPRLVAQADVEADIISFGLKFKLGGHQEEASYK